MRIVNLTSETNALVDESQLREDDWKARAEARNVKARELQDGLNAPIDLSRPLAVQHDAKTDRYQVKFSNDKGTLLLKCSDEVAAFVSEHFRRAGTWIGRMEKGVLVDAYLITIE